jgi:hypothetical protein
MSGSGDTSERAGLGGGSSHEEWRRPDGLGKKSHGLNSIVNGGLCHFCEAGGIVEVVGEGCNEVGQK